MESHSFLEEEEGGRRIQAFELSELVYAPPFNEGFIPEKTPGEPAIEFLLAWLFSVTGLVGVYFFTIISPFVILFTLPGFLFTRLAAAKGHNISILRYVNRIALIWGVISLGIISLYYWKK